jgi:anti-sigma B factor antagonist
MEDGLISFATRASGSAEVVEARGELDLTNANQLEDVLASATRSVVVLDLGGLSFLDSAGMRTIDQANRRYAESGRHLLVVAPRESRAAWAFRIAGFDEDLLLESLEHALVESDRRNAPSGASEGDRDASRNGDG